MRLSCDYEIKINEKTFYTFFNISREIQNISLNKFPQQFENRKNGIIQI